MLVSATGLVCRSIACQDELVELRRTSTYLSQGFLIVSSSRS